MRTKRTKLAKLLESPTAISDEVLCFANIDPYKLGLVALAKTNRQEDSDLSCLRKNTVGK